MVTTLGQGYQIKTNHFSIFACKHHTEWGSDSLCTGYVTFLHRDCLAVIECLYNGTTVARRATGSSEDVINGGIRIEGRIEDRILDELQYYREGLSSRLLI